MIPESVVDVTPVTVANGTEAQATALAAQELITVRVVGGQHGPVQKVHAELGGLFEGMWIDVRTNFKRGLARKMDHGEIDDKEAALLEIILDHNILDDDGRRYPIPLTVEALDDMSVNLYSMVWLAVRQAVEAATTTPKA